ncbi:HPr family phosphocarrier protein [Microbacterium gorillae]|uniref:HPr family phosphocarrier protein n=1 Tax=Microbacterium gorillae TaxID=1231063 RepID=UPI00058DDA71|nr:HPr family phosphocarrier protein [Microbacterium gorillae]
MTTIDRSVTVGSSHGLHARPAKLFTQAAKDTGVPITIRKGEGKPANAASILAVIALGAEQGDEVTLSTDADAPNAAEALDALAALLASDIDAE